MKKQHAKETFKAKTGKVHVISKKVLTPVTNTKIKTVPSPQFRQFDQKELVLLKPAAMSETDLKEKFKAEIYEEDWIVMRPHNNRGGLILVDDKLDLVAVAIKVAQDDAEQIKLWLEQKQLSKPTPDQSELWDQTQPRFRSVIVQPFVLAQIIS